MKQFTCSCIIKSVIKINSVIDFRNKLQTVYVFGEANLTFPEYCEIIFERNILMSDIVVFLGNCYKMKRITPLD